MWYRVPQAGSGTVLDPYRPLYSDPVADGLPGECFGYSGGQVFGEAPMWLARFYGDETFLEALAEAPDAQEFQGQAAEALNDRYERDLDLGAWEKRFQVIRGGETG